MEYNYITNPRTKICVKNEQVLTIEELINAIDYCNVALRKLYEQAKDFDINIFEVLGMRNLSGMVGEYLGKSIQKIANGKFQSNLHQDGYPDLLLTNTKERKAYFGTLYTVRNGKKYPKDKSLFSPYKFGGVEVKATCGSTPSASVTPKPLIGEQRISKVKSFDWKAHHRETNNLLAIFWDFINEVPTVAACFYRDDLTIDDWGKIVEPKEGGGRTTSVSIMTSGGVSKMCKGWVAVIDNPAYTKALASNKWIGYDVLKTKG